MAEIFFILPLVIIGGLFNLITSFFVKDKKENTKRVWISVTITAGLYIVFAVIMTLSQFTPNGFHSCTIDICNEGSFFHALGINIAMLWFMSVILIGIPPLILTFFVYLAYTLFKRFTRKEKETTQG